MFEIAHLTDERTRKGVEGEQSYMNRDLSRFSFTTGALLHGNEKICQVVTQRV